MRMPLLLVQSVILVILLIIEVHVYNLDTGWGDHFLVILVLAVLEFFLLLFL